MEINYADVIIHINLLFLMEKNCKISCSSLHLFIHSLLLFFLALSSFVHAHGNHITFSAWNCRSVKSYIINIKKISLSWEMIFNLMPHIVDLSEETKRETATTMIGRVVKCGLVRYSQCVECIGIVPYDDDTNNTVEFIQLITISCEICQVI